MLKRIETGLDMPFALPAEALTEQAELRKNIGEWNSDRDKNVAKKESLRSVSAQQFTKKHKHEAEAASDEHLDLLQGELAIRAGAGEFFAQCADEWYLTAREDSFQRMENAKASVRGKLISIGYTETPLEESLGTPLVHSITDEMIRRHPAVHRALVEYSGLSNEAALAAMKVNAERMQQCEQEIQSIRDAALGVVSR